MTDQPMDDAEARRLVRLSFALMGELGFIRSREICAKALGGDGASLMEVHCALERIERAAKEANQRGGNSSWPRRDAVKRRLG